MTKSISKILLVIMSLFVILQFAAPMTVHAAEYDYGVTYHEGTNGDFTLNRGAAYMDNEGKEGVWNKIFNEYKGVIVGITGIGTLTMVCLFIFNFMKLGQSAGNPQARSQALTGLLWTGLAAAGLGGVTIFVGFSSNLLRSKGN